MADDTSTPVPITTTSEVSMPAYPWPALDSVVGAAEQAFSERQGALGQSLIRQNEGAAVLVEQMRQSFSVLNQNSTAVIVQALNGSDPALQAQILAARAVQAQPNTTGQLVSNAPQPAAH